MAVSDKNAPWKPSDYDKSVVVAVQAVALGTANADQQKQALVWIVEKCCKTYEQSYRPNSQTDTAFAEGKRFVGTEIIKLTKLKTGNLK